MPIDPEKLLAHKFPEIEHTYAQKDTILYALGLGCGADPEVPDDLRFVYEKGLKALPTMAVVLADPGNWLSSPESGIDYSKTLHGEQSLTLHRPIPATGTVIGSTRITDVLDKGKDKGAVLYCERTLLGKASDAPIATMRSTIMCRGDGGFGGKSGPQPAPHALPETAPVLIMDLKTFPNSALIYRLSGDWNPLHADPAAAADAGFQRPVLHGLCSFGIAGCALVKGCCGGDPARLKSIQLRFSSPVYPGETIRTEMWSDGARISFRARVVERDTMVLSNGLATVD